MLLYKYFAVKCKVHCQLQLDRCCFCHCHYLAIVAGNGEITKVMVSEKEETMENWLQPSMARSLFSHTGHYCFQLILKAIMFFTEERSGWSHIACLFFLYVDHVIHRKKGWLRETKVRSHETRIIAAEKGEYAKYFLLSRLNQQSMVLSMEYGDFKPHEADTFESDHVIAYKQSSKFNLQNVLMEVNLDNFLPRKLPAIRYICVCIYVKLYHMEGNFGASKIWQN